MMSPVVGSSIAAAVAGERPNDYLRAFSLERFDSGELIPEPAIV